MFTNFFKILFTLCIVFNLNATTIATSKTKSISQWEVIDIPFKANTSLKNPFLADFTATFLGPNNVKLVVPGFYNGANNWVIRFSASTPGDWTYTTQSEIKWLNAKKGAIKVLPNTKPNKHGGIVVDKKNSQYFSYEDGTPYMQLAFECDWLFALDYHNPTTLPKSEHLLNLVNKNGFNQIVTTVYSFDVNWKKDEKLKSHPEHEYGGNLSIYPFLGTNDKPDFSLLNVAFFQKFDRVIALMNDKDIAAHLMIYVWNKLVKWPDAETEADNMYFDYIIKRYQAYPNIIWDVSKEALNNKRCSEDYGVERIQRIRNLDAYKRLVSVHDFGFCSRNSDKVDFISTQNWSATIYHDMLTNRKDFPNHPIFNIEHGGYEIAPYDVFAGDYTNAEVCLRRNYLCAFAGVYSTYYWQGASWNAIIHNPYEQGEDFIKPKFDYYKNFVDFFKKYQFSDFKPDPANNFSSFCLTNTKGTYLAYIPKENEKLSLYWTSTMYSNKGTVQWFNTLTGKYSAEEPVITNLFTSPWKGDADAILIRKIN